MNNVISALTARTQLGQILKRVAEGNERFLIDRRGEPAVVILSIRDYMNSFAPPPSELRAMQERAKRTGTNKLGMREINSVIAAVRKSQNKGEKPKATNHAKK